MSDQHGAPVQVVPATRSRMVSRAGGMAFVALAFLAQFAQQYGGELSRAFPSAKWISPLCGFVGALWLAVQRVREIGKTESVNMTTPAPPSA